MTFNPDHISQFLFFASWMLVFALVRPAMVRDYDGRRLPYNPQSRFIIAIIYLLIYGSVAIAFELFGEMINSVIKDIPRAGNFMSSVHLTAPFYAIATLGVLWQIPFVNEIDRAFLIALHSSRNVRDNAVLLWRHIGRCPFDPSAEERSFYEYELNEHGVFFKDDEAQRLDIIIVHNWRKVATQIRLVQGWNEGESRVLSTEDMKLFEELKKSHERKTALACHIITMFQEVGKETDPTTVVANLKQILSNKAPTEMPDAIEKYLKSMLGKGTAEGGLESPVELSAEQFLGYVHQIESYFQAEYRTLLQQMAQLTSKSIVLSGAARVERLEQLKTTGFAGIGYFNYVSVDRLLWIFLLAAFGGYLVMFYGVGGGNPQGLARFAVTMAVAGLIGGIVGSIRSYARASEPRWDVYLGAGLLSVGLYLGFTVLHNIALKGLPVAGDATGPLWTELLPPRSIPFSLLHLTLTVAICYFARQKSWNLLPGSLDHFNRYFDRIIDGVLVSLAVLVGYYVALALLPLFKLGLPPNVEQQMEAWHELPRLITIMLPYPVLLPLQTLAFLIGFLFVRDVRTSAHATIVEGA